MLRRVRGARPAWAVGVRVLELGVAGPLGRWMVGGAGDPKRSWGGFTLRLPFFTLVLYWLAARTERVAPQVRYHEWWHVFQWNTRFDSAVASWRGYLAEHRQVGYRGNRYEQEAYEETASALQAGLPAWATE